MFAVLGLVAARPTADSRTYEASAMVLVAPPPDQTASFQAAPDRYVRNQLVLLGSELVAFGAAERLDGFSADEVIQRVEFEQVADTDVIVVSAASDSAEEARDIANAYVESYVEVFRSRLSSEDNPELDLIATARADVEERLDTVNSEIVSVLAPFVQRSTGGA